MVGPFYISKRYKFECAHRLRGLRESHPCQQIHGHSYKVEVTIYSDTLDDRGFIIDFGDLSLFQKWIDLHLDHSLVLTEEDYYFFNTNYIGFLDNQKYFVMPNIYKNTSAESFANYFCIELLRMIDDEMKDARDHINGVEVKVWETENNMAGYRIFKEKSI